MELNGSQTENFDKIEKAVQKGELDSLSVNELLKIKQVLLTGSPLSDNPRFIQRWERVNTAVMSKIESKTTSKRFKIQIVLAILTLLFVLLNIYLSHSDVNKSGEIITPSKSAQSDA